MNDNVSKLQDKLRLMDDLGISKFAKSTKKDKESDKPVTKNKKG